MNEDRLTLAALLAACILGGAIFWYVHPRLETESIVKQAAISARAHDLSTQEGNLVVEDGWGSKCRYERALEENGMAVAYVYVSPGRDRKFDTKDDIIDYRVDHNLSKMAGQAMGKSVKESWKGVKEGWAADSKFDDDPEEDEQAKTEILAGLKSLFNKETKDN